MKLREFIPYIIIAILMYFLISGSHKTTEVITIPEKENTFVRENLQPVIEYDTVYKNNIIEKIVRKENPVNQELLKKYHAAQDSIERLNLHISAITKRTYKEVYQDENQSITVTSEVTGSLERQEVSYNIYSQGIEVKNPTEGLYLGAGLQTSYRYLKIPEPEVNVSILKNKQMYTVGVGFDHIKIDYKHKIF